MNRKTFLLQAMRAIKALLVVSTFWCLIQFGFYVTDHILDRIDWLSQPSQSYKYYEQTLGYKNKRLVIHGLCRPYTYVKPISDHLDDVSVLSMKYHGGMIRNYRHIDTDDIEIQIAEAAKTVSTFHPRGTLVVHSYSAAMCVDLSLMGLLPKNIDLVLVCPAIAVKDYWKIKLATTLFEFYYYLRPTKKLLPNLIAVLWKTAFLTRRDEHSRDVCRKFIEENQLFSRTGLYAVVELADSVRKKISSGAKLQNNYILVLSENDIEVENHEIIRMISEGAKKVITVPGAPHSAFQSRNNTTRNKFFTALDDALGGVEG